MEKQHTTIVRLNILVSVLLTVLYFVKFRPLTALPVVLWNSFCCNRDKYGKYISIGLVFGAIGDITLPSSFIGGLLFFLVNHFVDIYAFNLSNPERSWISLSIGFMYCVGIGILILPSVDAAMIAPCAIYLVTLVYTCCLSVDRLVSGVNTSVYSGLLAIVGSLMFVASDTLLAYSIFVGSSRYLRDSEAIMLTYFVAQLTIAMSSFVDAPHDDENPDFGGKNDTKGVPLLLSENEV